MQAYGGDAVIVDDYRMNGATVSSTRIRALLAEGKCAEARELLGMPYFISGRVDRGRGDGRSFGFPTVNTELYGIPLKHGVYRTVLDIDGSMHQGLTNIGVCPTMGARSPHAETYILDFDGDLYGRSVRIFLIEFLREEKCFSTKEELIMQINIDKNTAIERNKNIKWQDFGLNLQ
jgi:riboflavin kinase/FMN adenylyltransferase